MADLKDDGESGMRDTTRAADQQTMGDKDATAENKHDATRTTKMPPSGGYTELRSEPEEPLPADKDDGAEVGVELRHTLSGQGGGGASTAPGDGGQRGAGGQESVQTYKVYKRRWFGLVQLTLLNIIVSWDVSGPQYHDATRPPDGCDDTHTDKRSPVAHLLPRLLQRGPLLPHRRNSHQLAQHRLSLLFRRRHPADHLRPTSWPQALHHDRRCSRASRQLDTLRRVALQGRGRR